MTQTTLTDAAGKSPPKKKSEGKSVDDVDESDDSDIEYTILGKREVNAFQIAGTSNAKGHSAEAWKDKCCFSGNITVTAKGSDATIKLTKPGTDELFLQTTIENGEYEKFVERTVDSSRYFVIRAVHPVTKKAVFLGLGFEDRNNAFDFNCCLTDFKNRIENACVGAAAEVLKYEKKDFRLKEGQMLTINLGNKKKSAGSGSTAGSATSGGASCSTAAGGAFAGLPPPPSAPTSAPQPLAAPPQGLAAPPSAPPSHAPATTAAAAFPTGATTFDPDAKTAPKKSSKKSTNPFADDTDPFAADGDFFGDFQNG